MILSFQGSLSNSLQIHKINLACFHDLLWMRGNDLVCEAARSPGSVLGVLQAVGTQVSYTSFRASLASFWCYPKPFPCLWRFCSLPAGRMSLLRWKTALLYLPCWRVPLVTALCAAGGGSEAPQGLTDGVKEQAAMMYVLLQFYSQTWAKMVRSHVFPKFWGCILGKTQMFNLLFLWSFMETNKKKKTYLGQSWIPEISGSGGWFTAKLLINWSRKCFADLAAFRLHTHLSPSISLCV